MNEVDERKCLEEGVHLRSARHTKSECPVASEDAE